LQREVDEAERLTVVTRQLLQETAAVKAVDVQLQQTTNRKLFPAQ